MGHSFYSGFAELLLWAGVPTQPHLALEPHPSLAFAISCPFYFISQCTFSPVRDAFSVQVISIERLLH